MIVAAQENIIVHGFAGIKVDELAKIMNVSRAKLYQYFGSKDGVIEAIVQRYLDYVAMIEVPTEMSTPGEFVQAFPRVYTANIAYLGTTTAVFLRDLQQDYPRLYQQFMQAQRTYEQKVLRFYRDGQAVGFFNREMLPRLVVLQDQQVIPAMLTHEFVLRSDETVATLINRYFDHVIHEIVVPIYQQDVRQHQAPDQFDRVITTYSRLLMA